MSKKLDKYYKVIAVENSDSADILLYGYIGQEKWWDDDPTEPLTDLAFAQTIKDLEQKFDRINVRINSPGGSMYHGNAIITAMQNSKAEIHTYNDGMAASMAGDIWIAGAVRHMAKNALLMIHAPSSYARGTAKQLRQEADVLDKFEYTAIAVMAAATGETDEAIKKSYYDYEDHWFTAPDVQEMKLISTVEDYEAQEVPQDADKMTMSQLVKRFADKGDEQAKRWMQGFQNYLNNVIGKRTTVAKTVIDNTQKVKKMESIDDILKAVDDGKINPVDLQDRLKAHKPTASTPAPPPAEPVKEAAPAPESTEAMLYRLLTAKLKPLQDENAALKNQVAKLEKAPAAAPAKIDTDPAKTETFEDGFDELDAFNMAVEKAAATGEKIRVTGSGVSRKPKK